MKIVIFGLTVSSSWGNGHATLWRGLCRALIQRGHSVIFYERDVPYYSEHRDLDELPGGKLRLFSTWTEIASEAAEELATADIGMVTSYCPDGLAATEAVRNSAVGLKVFYDLDTPVTLERIKAGHSVGYIGADGLRAFDLVLSFTGGRALQELQTYLHARRVAAFYGSVDPAVHKPVAKDPAFRADLSYLGTYAEDRQAALEELFIRPAREFPHARFLLGGAQYPEHFPWTDNIFFVRHLEPSRHPAFFSSSRLTLNVTRGAMAAMGYCPSGRLFEAAACGVPIVTDSWEGLDAFFEPGTEICVVARAADVVAAMALSDAELSRIAEAARERVLAEHTAMHRVIELEAILEKTVSEIKASSSSQAADDAETARTF